MFLPTKTEFTKAFDVRPLNTRDDIAFVLSSFADEMHDYGFTSGLTRAQIQNTIVKPVENILRSQPSPTLVSTEMVCMKDQPDEMIAWIMHSPSKSALFGIYVKFDFRKMGIASYLLLERFQSMRMLYLFSTQAGSKLIKNLNLAYRLSPYLAFSIAKELE